MSYNKPLKDPERLDNFLDDETDDDDDEDWYARMDKQKKKEEARARAREKANFDVKNNGLEKAKKLQGTLNSMLDVDYNKMMEGYKLSAQYDETDKKFFLNGFMWQAHLDMRELYKEFVEKVKTPLDEIKNTFLNNNEYGYDLKTGDNEVMNETAKLTKPKRELKTLYKKFRENVSETGKMVHNNKIKLPFPYCPPLDKKGNVIKFKKEEKDFIKKWLAFCKNVKKKESEVTEYKRQEADEKKKEFKAEEKYPEAFFEWNIPIDPRFPVTYSNITNIDQIVLDWIKLKTERKKGGRKRTRRKKRRRRRKSTKKKRRRKRRRTKKKRRRRRR